MFDADARGSFVGESRRLLKAEKFGCDKFRVLVSIFSENIRGGVDGLMEP